LTATAGACRNPFSTQSRRGAEVRRVHLFFAVLGVLSVSALIRFAAAHRARCLAPAVRLCGTITVPIWVIVLKSI
jgi:Ca2+/H+ antiporter